MQQYNFIAMVQTSTSFSKFLCHSWYYLYMIEHTINSGRTLSARAYIKNYNMEGF